MKKGRNHHFPKGFLWGASVSTHQVEGGNHNQWSVWELENARVQAAQASYKYGHLKNWKAVEKEAAAPSNYVSGVAADHFNRFEHDFALAKQLRFSAMRSGIEWSRIEPEPGKFNKEALEHYRTYFKKMRAAGLVPIVTLWHWTLPVWLAERGGFKKRGNIKYFVRYVQFLLESAPELFEGYVLTINEPTIYASESYLHRRWPPQEGSVFAMHHVMVHLATAHRKAFKAIKKRHPKAKVGIAHHGLSFYAGDNSFISRMSAWVSHKMANEYFVSLAGKKKQDFIGLNYYMAPEFHGLRVHNPTNRVNDLGWDMQPAKMQQLLEKLWRKYQKPLILTESGVADREDIYRQWWIEESIKAMDQAIQSGVKMLGYIHWSLLDNFEWAEGFWPRFGLIEVNYKTQQRKARESAKWYSRFIHSLGVKS